MKSLRIGNWEDVRAFAREHGRQIPVKARREWLEQALLDHFANIASSLRKSDDVNPPDPNMSAAHEEIVRFSSSPMLTEEIAHLATWLAGLRESDPRLSPTASLLDALAMSGSGSDSADTPLVLEEPSLGMGWHWAWLHSPEARQAGNAAMGYKIRGELYRRLEPSEAIVMLRDANGDPHVILHLRGMKIVEDAWRDGYEVPAKYHAPVDRAAKIIGMRLYLNNDPTRLVADGPYSRNKWSLHVRGGLLHREDSPAVERADGTSEWYRNGELHRDGAPAIERADGVKCWYRNGLLHREDGPAVEQPDGSKCWYMEGHLQRVELHGGTTWWYRNGKLHRDGGPAVEQADGARHWYRNGHRHREDGPAVERAHGTSEWYFDGQRVAEPDLRPEMPPSTSLR